MRESLRQLGLALALPIAVAAVWIVRGDSAGAPARESGAAYRAELAELPLPSRDRLRAPSNATRWRGARVTPEEPTARHRRPVLPNASAAPPVDLAVAADSEIEVAASASPRAAQEPPDAAPSARLPALLPAPALIAAAPSAVSPRPRSVPKGGASAVPATDSEVPAESKTGSDAVEPPTETGTGKPVTEEPASTTVQEASTPVRIAAFEPVLGLLQRDTLPVRGGALVPLRNWAKLPGKLSPTFVAPTEIDKGRLQEPEKTTRPTPLPPTRPAADPVFDLSLKPDVLGPSGPIVDLPLPALEHAAASKFADPVSEISSPAPVFSWSAFPPMTLVTIPEPGSALLLGAALAALGWARRRPRRA